MDSAQKQKYLIYYFRTWLVCPILSTLYIYGIILLFFLLKFWLYPFVRVITSQRFQIFHFKNLITLTRVTFTPVTNLQLVKKTFNIQFEKPVETLRMRIYIYIYLFSIVIGLQNCMRYEIGSSIYIYYDAKCHRIPNPATMNRLFNNWDRRNARSDECQKVNDIDQNARLVQFQGSPKAYFLNKGVLRHIRTLSVFEACNFKYGNILYLPAADEQKYQTGPDLNF